MIATLNPHSSTKRKKKKKERKTVPEKGERKRLVTHAIPQNQRHVNQYLISFLMDIRYIIFLHLQNRSLRKKNALRLSSYRYLDTSPSKCNEYVQRRPLSSTKREGKENSP